jgi:RHS repeat-associated protein
VIELLANRLGSIITAISLSTGAVAAEYDCDSFGTRTRTGALEQRYGFTGREYDSESGLMHYRARVYDPAAGVFLQVDPIGFQGRQANLYAYVANNPMNWIDPSGHAVVEYGLGVHKSQLVAAGAVGYVGFRAILLANKIAAILSATTPTDNVIPFPGGGGKDDDDDDDDGDGEDLCVLWKIELIAWWVKLNEDVGGRNDIARQSYRGAAGLYNSSYCVVEHGPVPTGFE